MGIIANTGSFEHLKSADGTMTLENGLAVKDLSGGTIWGADGVHRANSNLLKNNEGIGINNGQILVKRSGSTIGCNGDGISVTSVPNTLTRGNGLAGGNFNGSAATSWRVDAGAVASDGLEQVGGGGNEHRMKVKLTSSSGLRLNGDGLGVATDGGTIGITGTGIRVNNVPNTLTRGNGLSGGNFNGAAGTSWRVDGAAIAFDGLQVRAGGGNEHQIQIKLTSSSGLRLNGDGLGVATDGGTIGITGTGIQVNNVPNNLTIGSGLAASADFNGAAARTVQVGAGDGIQVDTNAIQVKLTSSSGLRKNGDGLGLQYNSGQFQVDPGGNFKVKAGGINGTELNSAVAGNGLGGGGGSPLAVNVGDGIQIAGDAVKVKLTSSSGLRLNGDGLGVATDGGTIGITGTGIQVNNVPNNLTIGSGLAASADFNGAAARTVQVGAGTGITVNTNDIAVNPALTHLTDLDFTSAGSRTIFDSVGANTLTLGASTTTVKIAGDLEVVGTVNSVTTNNLMIEDHLIVASSGSDSSAANNGGLIVGGDGALANGVFSLTWDHGRTAIAVRTAGTVAGYIDNDGSGHIEFKGKEGNVGFSIVDHASDPAERIIKCGMGIEIPNGAPILPAVNGTSDLGSNLKRWGNIYTSDLNMANDRGSWRLIEENSFLTLRNEKTGKRYKFDMTLLPEDQWDPDNNWTPWDERE